MARARMAKRKVRTQATEGRAACACACGEAIVSKGGLRRVAAGLPAFVAGHDHRMLCALVAEAGGVLALVELVRGQTAKPRARKVAS